MNIIATTRNVQGTGASRRLRRADKLPGIVYGGNLPATPIELEHIRSSTLCARKSSTPRS